MKRFILSAIALVISSSVIAGGDGQIISERTIVLGNAKNVEFKRIEGGAPNSKYASANAHAYSASGQINRNIGIHSDHRYTITNYNTTKKRYHFKYEVTAEGGEGTYHEGDVDVNPQGTWFDAAQLNFVTNKGISRVYTIKATTEVKGESSAHDEDRATLTVR